MSVAPKELRDNDDALNPPARGGRTDDILCRSGVGGGPGGPGGGGHRTHRPYGGHDDAQDVGHDVHQHAGPLEPPGHAAQGRPLGTLSFHLLVPEDSESGGKAEEGEKGLTCALAAPSRSGVTPHEGASHAPRPDGGGVGQAAWRPRLPSQGPVTAGTGG